MFKSDDKKVTGGKSKAIRYLLLAVEYSAIAAVLIGIWALAALRAGNDYILPSPRTVLVSLGELFSESRFVSAIALSFLRVFAGVASAIILAVILAVLAAGSKHLKRFIKPINEIVKATPIVSFIFLAYIIFQKNIGILPIFITGLIVFPVVYGATLDALLNVDREQYEVAEVFGCTRFEKLKFIILPTTFNAFVSSSGTALGLGWKAGIAAEALAASPALVGIGTEIATAKTMIETPKQFAWTLVIIVLSYVIGVLFDILMNRLKVRLL